MIERRFLKGAEIRADQEGHISGHAAVFNQEYVLWDSPGYRYVEVVKPGAFSRALDEQHDVRCLFNHDPNQLLGRTAAGTMKLKEDDKGLFFDATLPDTQLGRDLPVLVKRGDVTGASFAFTVTKQTNREEKNGDQIVCTREIEDVDLFDASPVTYPAYTGTDVNARTLQMRATMFPAGVPAMLLDRVPELRDAEDGDPEADQHCRCRCRACFSAECDECDMHMQRCADMSRCDHSAVRSIRSVLRGDKPTKRVDNEDLTSNCFIYVGDPEKPATWALPWKFSTAAKTKSHLRNALARFNQTSKIPADSKAAAWKKLVRICKKYGIKVTDDESKAWALTAEQRADLRDTIGGGEDCECDCPECQVGDCGNCSDPDCDDDDCNHDGDGDADEDDRAAMLVDVDARLRLAGLKPTA
jgi:HK97 family phage prohead protease